MVYLSALQGLKYYFDPSPQQQYRPSSPVTDIALQKTEAQGWLFINVPDVL